MRCAHHAFWLRRAGLSAVVPAVRDQDLLEHLVVSGYQGALAAAAGAHTTSSSTAYSLQGSPRAAWQ